MDTEEVRRSASVESETFGIDREIRLCELASWADHAIPWWEAAIGAGLRKNPGTGISSLHDLTIGVRVEDVLCLVEI